MAMSTAKPTQPYDDHGATTTTIVEAAGHGGRIATIFSALALIFSGYTFYESVLRAPSLEVHIPPVINYARDDGGSIEVLAIPLTIANSGARTGTVLSVELQVHDPATKTTKSYYSAFIGEHPKDAGATKQAFAPISVPGRSVFSNTVLFYPAGDILPALVTREGAYELTLKINAAQGSEGPLFGMLAPALPEPIKVTMSLPYFSMQSLAFRRSTIPMHTADWKPTSSRPQAEQ
jgi:hypothetical protein